MATSLQRSAAWNILRSRGVGAVMLTVGWLAVNQAATWGQRPEDADQRPGDVKKPAAVKVTPPVNGAPPPAVVPDETLLRALADGRFNGGFGGGLSGGFPGPPPRLTFRIDPKTPIKVLLPTPPVIAPPMSPWLVKDLLHVPEVFFQKPLDLKAGLPKVNETKTPADIEKLLKQRREARNAAEQQVAFTLAKINHVNKQATDHFVQMLMEHRSDLAGLPFAMGDACRMSKGVSRQFVSEVGQVKVFGNFGGMPGGGFNGSILKGFSGAIVSGPQPADPKKPAPPPTADEVARAKVAAWMQILGPAPGPHRLELVKKLMELNHPDATRALTRLAIFSFDKEVRDAALSALTKRSGDDVGPILMQGVRYPWPEVGQNAAHAIAYLQRRDLAPELIDFLDEPDPRAPVVPADRCVPVVREVVRLNHHHNCITCHAPANSDPDFNTTGATTDFVVAPVSIPIADPTPPGQFTGGYNFPPSLSPDLFLRVDVTYLRQDFSLLQRTADTDFGPSPQRFDFLVRTREVSPDEARAYAAWAKQQGPSYRSPNHQAVHTTLRQLLGGNPPPTAEAWRKALAAKVMVAVRMS